MHKGKSTLVREIDKITPLLIDTIAENLFHMDFGKYK